MGALSVLAALAAGAAKVFLSEPNERRVQRPESLGATAVMNPRDVDVVEEVREVTGGAGVDVAIECAGNEAGLKTCLDGVRTRGTVTQVGLHLKPVFFDPMRLAEREISIVGTWAYSVHEWPRTTGQITSGAFPVERVAPTGFHWMKQLPASSTSSSILTGITSKSLWNRHSARSKTT